MAPLIKWIKRRKQKLKEQLETNEYLIMNGLEECMELILLYQNYTTEELCTETIRDALNIGVQR